MMAGTGPIAEEAVRIVPANEASWDDLRDIFGAADPWTGRDEDKDDDGTTRVAGP
jgi:hypothetical protein